MFEMVEILASSHLQFLRRKMRVRGRGCIAEIGQKLVVVPVAEHTRAELNALSFGHRHSHGANVLLQRLADLGACLGVIDEYTGIAALLLGHSSIPE